MLQVYYLNLKNSNLLTMKAYWYPQHFINFSLTQLFEVGEMVICFGDLRPNDGSRIINNCSKAVITT
ncbi:hypothetical protein Syn7502_02902 [Synechococcus sp. PCC 7502]|nr:hypothetical protein Syn7502_02902 [Synechococcus sp. PCC 7502]